MRSILLALVWLALAPSLAAAGEDSGWLGIFGRDDRDAVTFNAGWPWVAIGRVDRSDGGHCSGTLIARDRVLTAAHCVFDRETGGIVDVDGLQFRAGADRGDARAESRVRRLVVDPALEFDRQGRPRRLATDWAVLHLERPLYDGGWLRPVAVTAAEQAGPSIRSGMPLAQAGYSGDQSQRLTRNRACQSLGLSTEDGILLHDCDATFGDSGSPVLVSDGADYRLVAVHVAVVRIGNRSAGAAVLVPARALR